MPPPSLTRAPSETVVVAQTYDALCDSVAAHIAAVVQATPNAVLGLATGSTPLGVYERLVQRHRQHGLDFSGVTCFNLDEYFPMPAHDPHSYHSFMERHLFRHINCRAGHVPGGTPRPDAEVAEACLGYERLIADAGGIDLQLLGIGRTGHIGFNEPGSLPDSRTRLVSLHPATREDAAGSFGGLSHVPAQAVSMGIGTILDAREIVLMASGPAKAEIIHAAWTAPISPALPASWVRLHARASLYLDSAAAALFV